MNLSRNKIIFYGLALMILLAYVYAYYPGILSYDSVKQLSQARSGVYTNDHPATMAALWHAIDKLIPGSSGMLVFHLVLYVSGAALVCDALLKGPAKIWGLLWLTLFPSVAANLGTIWKDVGLIASLLLVVGLLLRARQSLRKLPWLLASLLPAFYALSVRHNAAPALYPLLVYALLILAPEKKVQAFVGGGLIFIFLLSFNFLLTRSLVEKRPNYYASIQALYDLAGISVHSNTLLFPSYPTAEGKPFTLEELKSLYNPNTIIDLYCCTLRDRHVKAPQNEAEHQEVMKLWVESILKYPLPYLAHRYGLFRRMVGLSSLVHDPYHQQSDPNDFGLVTPSNPLFKGFRAVVDPLKNSLFFRVWIFAVFQLGLLVFALVKSKLAERALILCLSTSSLLYLASFFPLSPAADFRYGLWTVVSALVLVLVFYKSRLSRVEFLKGNLT